MLIYKISLTGTYWTYKNQYKAVNSLPIEVPAFNLKSQEELEDVIRSQYPDAGENVTANIEVELLDIRME